MATRWPPRIDNGTGGGSGPPPPGGQDYFAPKYLVGNTVAGDSAVAYSAGGFIYIPDPGDGSGVAAALAAAAITPGDVWVRPGTYDFGLGAVALPVVVPAGILMRGAGASTIFVTPGDPAAVGDIAILTVNGEVRDFAIHMANPTTASPSASVAVMTVAATGIARRISLDSAVVTTPANLGTVAAAVQYIAASLSEDVACVNFPWLNPNGGGVPFVNHLVSPGAAGAKLTRLERPTSDGSTTVGGALSVFVQAGVFHVQISEPTIYDPAVGGILVEAQGANVADVQITDPHVQWRYADTVSGFGPRSAISMQARQLGGSGWTLDSVRVTRGYFDNFSITGLGSFAITILAQGAGFAALAKNCEVIGATCRNWDEAAHIEGTGISTVDSNGVVDTDTTGNTAGINNVNDLNFRALGNW